MAVDLRIVKFSNGLVALFHLDELEQRSPSAKSEYRRSNLNSPEITLNLISVGASIEKDILDAHAGQKLKSILNQGSVGQR